LKTKQYINKWNTILPANLKMSVLMIPLILPAIHNCYPKQKPTDKRSHERRSNHPAAEPLGAHLLLPLEEAVAGFAVDVGLEGRGRREGGGAPGALV
jgi:hypothetical protein